MSLPCAAYNFGSLRVSIMVSLCGTPSAKKKLNPTNVRVRLHADCYHPKPSCRAAETF